MIGEIKVHSKHTPTHLQFKARKFGDEPIMLTLEDGMKRIAAGNVFGLERVVWAEGFSSWANCQIKEYPESMKRKTGINDMVIIMNGNNWVATADLIG